jgi:chromosome segregation ATPase
MMYTGAVGVVVMDQMSTLVEGVEAVVQETRRGVERRWQSDGEERADFDQRLSAIEERMEREEEERRDLDRRLLALEDGYPEVSDLSRSNRGRITEAENVVDQLRTRVGQLVNQVTVLREQLLAANHPADNPIVIDDDDVGPGLVEPENGEVPGRLVEIEEVVVDSDDEYEEEGTVVGEDLEIRIARIDPAPEYIPPPDYE